MIIVVTMIMMMMIRMMMMMITIIGKNNPKCVTVVWAAVLVGIFIVSNSKFYVSASLSTSLQFIQKHIIFG